MNWANGFLIYYSMSSKVLENEILYIVIMNLLSRDRVEFLTVAHKRFQFHCIKIITKTIIGILIEQNETKYKEKWYKYWRATCVFMRPVPTLLPATLAMNADLHVRAIWGIICHPSVTCNRIISMSTGSSFRVLNLDQTDHHANSMAFVVVMKDAWFSYKGVT